MPRVNCPSCETTLSIPDPIPAAGRCPKCQEVIRLKTPTPAPAVITRQAPAAAPPRRAADLDAKRPRGVADEDEDEPRRSRNGRRQSESSLWQHPAFLIGLGFCLVLLLGGLGVGGYFLFRKGESSSSSSSASSSDKETEKVTTSYEIKFRKESKGDKTLIVKDGNGSMSTTLKDPGGKILMEKKDEKGGESFKYVEEILEKEGSGRATRVRRTYEKAESTEKGMTRTLSFQGKPILIEKKGPTYTFSVEGGKELPPEDASALAREFNEPQPIFYQETFFLPNKAVTVGDSWKIDIEPLIKQMQENSGAQVDLAKSTSTGKLIKVYKKDGKTFGVLEMKIDLALLPVGAPPDTTPLKNGARLSFTMNLDQCIDGTSRNSSWTGSMTSTASMLVPGPDGKQVLGNFDVRTTMSESHEERAR
jgi:hypothetical protein